MLALNAACTAAQQLKDLTKENHEAAESMLLPRIRNIKKQEPYISLLKLFYGFYHPLEKKINAVLDASLIPDKEQRRKSGLILGDLQALGAGVPFIPQAKQLPDLQNDAAAMGALYVLEGSTLGGRYIAKMLSQQVDPALQPGQLRFFTGYGSRTGVMWTGFTGMLHEFATDAYMVQQMADAANRTFLDLNLWFTAQPA
jgi:heme oxygenase (biliverdin-IX-beta and delta-forming)